MLKHVSASLAAPAPVPATKFSCASGIHPSVAPAPAVTVMIALSEPDAVAVTVAPWKSKVVMEPAVPIVLDSS